MENTNFSDQQIIFLDDYFKQTMQIDKLSEALANVQGEIQPLIRDRQAYKYKYADLQQTLDNALPILCKNKLSLTQRLVRGGTENHIGMWTMISHASGQWQASFSEMPIPNKVSSLPSIAQEVGSIISYMRRYTLWSALGMAQKDDDGAMGNTAAEEDNETSFNTNTNNSVKLLSDKQLYALKKYCKERRDTDMESYFLKAAQVNSLEELPINIAAEFIKKIKEKEEENSQQKAA